MKLVFTPDWFLSADVFIGVFSFLILSLFFYFCIKNYKLSRKKSFLYFGIGFLLIAIAELSTILTKLILYYDTTFTQSVGRAIVTYTITNSVDIFYYIGFFFHKLFTLFGLYIIYKIPLKKGVPSDWILSLFFLIIAALFSHGIYYIFYLTSLILLIFIIANYYEVYQKNKSTNTLILIFAFGGLALSQMIAILSKMKILYVIAQTLQAASYLILLILIIRILQYGKRKKKK